MKSVLGISDYRDHWEEKKCNYTVIAVQKSENCISEYLVRCLSAQEIFSNPYAYSEKKCWELLVVTRVNPAVEDEEGKCLSRTNVMMDWYNTIKDLFEEMRHWIEENGVEVDSVEDVLNPSEDSPAGNKYVWLATYNNEFGAGELIECE